MKNLLLATHNQGKIKRYCELFAEFKNIKLITLSDLNIVTKIDEPFSTSEENSAHKAREYGRLSKLPTIAIDEAVMTNFLPENEQPGVLVRRFKQNRELNDLEIINMWQGIFKNYPNKDLKFIWDFSLSYYEPESQDVKTIKAIQIDSVAEEFSKIIDTGYPMSSFLIPQNFNKTYSELTRAEFLLSDKNNLKPFLKFMEQINNF
jgi:inosine/xanthosine triphosphate pyrophosphatase family protein